MECHVAVLGLEIHLAKFHAPHATSRGTDAMCIAKQADRTRAGCPQGCAAVTVTLNQERRTCHRCRTDRRHRYVATIGADQVIEIDQRSGGGSRGRIERDVPALRDQASAIAHGDFFGALQQNQ